MLHKQVEATATPTIEKGTAVLLVAAYTKDRGGDVIQRGAFRSTIAAWKESGKQVPLAWNHDTGEPERLIGTVDPRSLKETRDGLLAEARLDLDGSEVARSVWRLIKSDSIGVSFGYLATEEEDAGDGVRLLKAIDIYEISLTAVPMHGDTRVVSWKSARRGEEATRPELHAVLDGFFTGRTQPASKRKRRTLKQMEEEAAEAKAVEALKAEVERQQRRKQPVRIKSFDC